MERSPESASGGDPDPSGPEPPREIASEVVAILEEEGYLEAVEAAENERGKYSDGIANVIHTAGGVIVASFGLVCVLAITVNLVDNVAGDQRAALITTAFTVIGTVVGGYVGARAGAKGLDEAQRSRDREAAKVQELAAELSPGKYHKAINRADKRTRKHNRRGH